MVIGFLELSNWTGISIGAVHWYAKLVINDPYESIEIKRPLSDKEIKELNVAEEHVSHFKGDLTHKFDTEQEAFDFGVKTFKDNYTGVLFRGEAACRSAWSKIIVYPVSFSRLVENMNEIADKFIAINGYEGPKKKLAERLDNRWYKRYTTLCNLCKG